ncbi:MAG TPA: hypothetical protein VMZ31_19265 [Phycisphaerae bacterium]|nr:hypothetical protein [Phycisphaerae bacterium]
MFADLRSSGVRTALGAVVPLIVLTVAVLLGLTSLNFDGGYVGKVNAETKQVANATAMVAAPQLGGASWQGRSPLHGLGSGG